MYKEGFYQEYYITFSNSSNGNEEEKWSSRFSFISITAQSQLRRQIATTCRIMLQCLETTAAFNRSDLVWETAESVKQQRKILFSHRQIVDRPGNESGFVTIL